MKSAHVHLISAILGELKEQLDDPKRKVLRVLDIGCGYGGLISDLMQVFSFFADKELEVYGFEVNEHRGSTPDFYREVCDSLAKSWPEVNWEQRIRLGSSVEPWPFPDGFFDLAYSNQVIEHVAELELFFQETRRVLADGAKAVHFYPSRSVFVEPHCGVPGAHWIENSTSKERWLRLSSSLGLGKFPNYRRRRGSCLDSFCDEFSDYLKRFVFFRSNREIRELGERYFERCGFKYDGALASRKLRDDWEPYAYAREGVFRRVSPLSFFACSTLVQVR